MIQVMSISKDFQLLIRRVNHFDGAMLMKMISKRLFFCFSSWCSLSLDVNLNMLQILSLFHNLLLLSLFAPCFLLFREIRLFILFPFLFRSLGFFFVFVLDSGTGNS